ncbi:MAG: hypothetical protein J0L69_02745 [Bacteroidetes bacterium]|nr:hypothetical protein [Bacteroidota bacterium]
MVRFSKIFVSFLEGLPFVVAILFLFGCRKEDIMPEYSKAKFSLILKNANTTIIWDSLNNTNAAGNIYSVESLQFYISDLTFKNSKKTITSNKIIYIDGSVNSTCSFLIDSIAPGDYTEVSFVIGLSNLKNISGSLPNTIENLNMAWPDGMGGGYHFMKLEGRYLDTLAIKRGYAIHLGKNNFQPKITISKKLTQKFWNHEYKLVFNINEVFQSPNLYNLNFENNYTMNDTVANRKIINNIKDAFSLE